MYRGIAVIMAAAALLAACGGSGPARSTASGRAATPAPAPPAPAPAARAAALPGSCEDGVPTSMVSDAVGRPVQLQKSTPSGRSLSCWYAVPGASASSPLGTITVVYTLLDRVPTSDEVDQFLKGLRKDLGEADIIKDSSQQPVPGLGDRAVYIVSRLEVQGATGSVWELAAVRDRLLVDFGMYTISGTPVPIQGDRDRMSPVVRRAIG